MIKMELRVIKEVSLVEIFLIIIGSSISLYIFYVIIERAVREGINKSNVGRFFEEKYGIKE